MAVTVFLHYFTLACTEFCERWAHGLLEKYAYSFAEDSDVNPLDLKSISETYKLKVRLSIFPKQNALTITMKK